MAWLELEFLSVSRDSIVLIPRHTSRSVVLRSSCGSTRFSTAVRDTHNTPTCNYRLFFTMSLGRNFTLPTGAKIPAVGFGTFASEGSKGESYRAVIEALRAGYRYAHFLWNKTVRILISGGQASRLRVVLPE